RDPRGRGGLLGELREAVIGARGDERRQVVRVVELPARTGLAAVRVGDVLVVALEVLGRTGLRPGGLRARGHGDQGGGYGRGGGLPWLHAADLRHSSDPPSPN